MRSERFQTGLRSAWLQRAVSVSFLVIPARYLWTVIGSCPEIKLLHQREIFLSEKKQKRKRPVKDLETRPISRSSDALQKTKILHGSIPAAPDSAPSGGFARTR